MKKKQYILFITFGDGTEDILGYFDTIELLKESEDWKKWSKMQGIIKTNTSIRMRYCQQTNIANGIYFKLNEN